MGSRLSATAAAALILLFSLCARAQDADTHLASGLEHFAAKRFDSAIADFKAGYALDPRPDFLYAWAQAERLRGSCRAAVPLYQRYLASGVTAEQAKLAADHLASCRPAMDSPRKEPWTRDLVGHLLVGAGAAALATGAVLFVSSSSTGAEDATTYAGYQDAIDSARTKRTIAWIALGSGAALVAGGLLHYALRDAPEITAWLEPAGGGLVVAGSF